MTIEALVVSVTLLVILALWVGAPLLGEKSQNMKTEAKWKQRERLITHYDRLLNNMRDLEEDYSTGKISTEDYQTDREALVQRGVQILIALDAQSGVVESKQYTHTAAVDESVDSAIEEAVKAYRRKADSYAK